MISPRPPHPPRRDGAPQKPGRPAGAQNRTPTARALAQRAIYLIIDRHIPLEDTLTGAEDWVKLAPRDRAFARLLVATVLRRLGQIDDILTQLVQRPPEGKDAYVQQILRVAAAQLLFLDTPPHGAVDEAVKMTRGPGMKAMVNAVLRKISTQRHALLRAQDGERLNLPDWLWRSWCEAYGEANTRAISRAHTFEPPLDITMRDSATTPIWAERLEGRALPNGSVRLGKPKRVPTMEGFAQGVWWVQDAAATFPALLLGDVSGQKIIDLAAAPGGKTLQLIAGGASVTAVDQSRERLERLFENLERMEFSADTDVADARYYRPKEQVDAVLLDTPCSATGTARRHPDVIWSKTPEAVASLTQLQDALLKNAANMVKPGGKLIYACCSLQPEEGPKRIEAFLRRHKDWKRQAVGRNEIPGTAEFLTEDGDLRTLPCQWPESGGIDGFYMARLSRAKTS
jgi:16S rRNA (cytosine967-C5)-methyltransferase